MHRFFIPLQWITPNEITLHEDTARQIASVLRMRPGEHCILLDNQGNEIEASLTRVTPQECLAQVIERRLAAGEPSVHITLYQSLTQREKFEWILQKCTELGASAFVPVISNRSLIRQWGKEEQKKIPRWEKIIKEAAEQSGRGKIPQLGPTGFFEQALKQAAGVHTLPLIPWEGEHALSLQQALTGVGNQGGNLSIALFIGPEGGFTEEEIALAVQSGIQPVTLGKRILRVETAAIAATALTLYALGEMS